MSYPKTLGELWDMGPETAEAWEQAERWEHEATERTLADELEEEQAEWMRDTLREFYVLTMSTRFNSEHSPNKIREMVQAVLDACQADY